MENGLPERKPDDGATYRQVSHVDGFVVYAKKHNRDLDSGNAAAAGKSEIPRSSGLLAHAAEVVIESLKRITNEWQIQFWSILTRDSISSRCCSGSLQMGSVVSLVDFIRREVSGVNIRG